MDNNNNVLGTDLGIEEENFEGQKVNVQKEYSGNNISELKSKVMNTATETISKCTKLAENYRGFIKQNKELAKELKNTTERLRECLEKLGIVEKDYNEVIKKIQTIKENSTNRSQQLEEQGRRDKEKLQKQLEDQKQESERRMEEVKQKNQEDLQRQKQEAQRLEETHKREEQEHLAAQKEEMEKLAEQKKAEADEAKRKAKEKFEQEMNNASQECQTKINNLKLEIDKMAEEHKKQLEAQVAANTEALNQQKQVHDKNKEEQAEKFKQQIDDLNKKNKEILLEEQTKIHQQDELKLKEANDKCEREKKQLLGEIAEVLDQLGDLKVNADNGARQQIEAIKTVVTDTCSKIDSLERKVKASKISTPTEPRLDDESKGNNNNNMSLQVPADFKLDTVDPPINHPDVANVKSATMDGEKWWRGSDYAGFEHWYQLFGNDSP